MVNYPDVQLSNQTLIHLSHKKHQVIDRLFENKSLLLTCPDLQEYYKVEERLSNDEIKVFVRETISSFRQRTGSIGVFKCPCIQSHRPVPALPDSDQGHMTSKFFFSLRQQPPNKIANMINKLL